MKTKQRTYQGNTAYTRCKEFADAMREIYEVKEINIKDLSFYWKPHWWVTKWRVIVKYGEY